MNRPSTRVSNPAVLLAGLAGLAFVLRLGARLWLTDAASVEEGYTIYLTIARTFAEGGGLCGAPGEGCSQRMPLYPLLLSPLVANNWLHPGLAIVQSLIGAATVWLIGAVARDLFGWPTALLAAAVAALNPYAVVHDTALQETSLVNGLLVLSVWLFLVQRRTESALAGLGAGAALALCVLTTARVALLLPAALAWVAFATTGAWVVRARRTALVAVPIVLLVGGWVGRNWRIEGAPVLTTESGVSLWVGNNKYTFSHFPQESIDLSAADAFRAITTDQRAAIVATNGKPVARDRLLREWAGEAIAADPAATAWNAVRKIGIAVSATFTPARSPLVQLGYAAFFLPIHALAPWGLWRSRRTDSAHLLSMAVIASFLVTTAVFWAHTSHKSLIDAVLFVYAAGAITMLRPRLAA